MKYRTTQKAIRSGFNAVIAVPYCALQTLLTFESPVAYTVRREGWGADIYDVGNGVAIVTGYAPFGKYKPEYAVREKYENLARRVLDGYTHQEAKEELRHLIADFIDEVSAENKSVRIKTYAPGRKCPSDIQNNWR